MEDRGAADDLGDAADRRPPRDGAAARAASSLRSCAGSRSASSRRRRRRRPEARRDQVIGEAVFQVGGAASVAKAQPARQLWSAGARVQAQPRLHADRRPAEGDRRAGRGPGGRGAVPDPARGDRDRQDLHDGGDDRRGAAALAGDRPQQDAGRAALQRVPRVLPRQRGRVLRLLLRLLPARGLRPGPGPLHREGLLDQRRDRPPAPRGDGGAVRPPRRDHRRLGLLHLRDRLAAGLQRKNAAVQGRRRRSTATRCCASW